MEEIIRTIQMNDHQIIVKAMIDGRTSKFCDSEIRELDDSCNLTLRNPCDEIDYRLPKGIQVRHLIVIKPRLFISSYLKHNKLI